MAMTEKQAQEWIADTMMTLAKEGPDAANNRILAQGRTDLQVCFTVLLTSYIRQGIEGQA